jgi:hypothetical protein
MIYTDTNNIKMRALKERNISKSQAMGTILLRYVKILEDTSLEISLKIYYQLDEKQFQLFDHVNRMDKMCTS